MSFRKTGSDLQPVSMTVSIPTSITLSAGDVNTVKVLFGQGGSKVKTDTLTSTEWSINASGNMDINWYDSSTDPLSAGSYQVEVEITDNAGKKLFAPSKGFSDLIVKLPLQ